MATRDPQGPDDAVADARPDPGARTRSSHAHTPTERGTPWDPEPGDDTDDGAGTPAPAPDDAAEDRPAKFAAARRRALLWNAGYTIVAGAVLMLLWGANRPLENFPDTFTLVAGIAALVWSGVLLGIASGGVGRTPTALVGLINVLAGLAGFALSWVDDSVPVLVLVLAAQVVGFGVVQWMTSIRR